MSKEMIEKRSCSTCKSNQYGFCFMFDDPITNMLFATICEAYHKKDSPNESRTIK